MTTMSYTDVIGNGNKGLGKPEPLQHDAGSWLRRIAAEYRLVYRLVATDEI